ncbi:hypothetical protein [Ruminococcus flavefaciens]|uniref:hypothetical protein n=1 Tax=Ruminococcus flavefaciens TaxID=1265 RepID=UPI0002F5A7EB|nr:hypothetical protein [Ruminococcus flavefaciens]
MSVGLEKTEQQLEKAYNELSVIRDRKADIIEKEKAVMAHIEKLENQRILQIVGIFNLNGDDLKKKLAAIMPANVPQTDSDESINMERTDEDE